MTVGEMTVYEITLYEITLDDISLDEWLYRSECIWMTVDVMAVDKRQ